MPIRLLVIDDNPWLRKALHFACIGTEIEIVAETGNGRVGMQMALERDIDVVLLDIRMPDDEGFEVLREIKTAKKDLSVLIYSACDSDDIREQLESVDADGFLQKGKDEERLINAIGEIGVGRESTN